MVTSIPLPDRGALYYPKLHFDNVDWLKATLLAFGRVSRIVPTDYDLKEDVPAVKQLSERHGATAPLIVELDPDHVQVERAQARLYRLLTEFDDHHLLQRFGRESASKAAQRQGEYRLHHSKVHDHMLSELVRNDLAWPVAGTPFLLVHPSLGEAIMGVSAIAAAKQSGLDVVTDAAFLHVAVSTLDEDALLHELAARPNDQSPLVSADRATARLAHAFLVTRFNLSPIPLEDIAGLVRDGADLRAFRRLLLSFAERVPPEVDEHVRRRQTELLMDEVDVAWREFQRRLPARLRTAFKDATSASAQDLIAEAAKGLVAAGSATALVAGLSAPTIVASVVGGVVPIVFALVKTALGVRRVESEPSGFRYLASITKAGGVELSCPRPYQFAET